MIHTLRRQHAEKQEAERQGCPGLAALAERLSTGSKHLPHALPLPDRTARPSIALLIELVECLRAVLFPGYFGTTELSDESMPFHVGTTLDRVLQALPEQIRRGFALTHAKSRDDASVLTRAFLTRLPAVQAQLVTDVQAAFEGDPAATCPEETIFCYPGMLAITYYRLAHELYALGVPLLPRIITEHAHSLTGIDIHPGATIGEHIFIDHGTGVVIGETAVIGNRVRIYQGVTLGAKSFPKDEHGNPVKGIPRHPLVEDDVVIYAGATILGRITIGRGSVIGGGVWVTENVPPGTTLSQAKERKTSTRQA